MRYIRLKSDPLKVLSYGYVGPGGLGDFDPELYEEVEGDLPEGWELYEPPTLLKRMAALFDGLPGVARGAFLPLKASVWKELEAEEPDLEAAWHTINLAQVPPELATIKAALLAELPTPPPAPAPPPTPPTEEP